MPDPMRWSQMTGRHLDEEIEQHLDDRYNELVACGVAPAAAARRVADEVVGWTPPRRGWFPGLDSDVRYAVRTLDKNAGFSTVVIFSLALGIGATAAVFSVLDHVLLRPLPYPNVDRILTITERTTSGQLVSVAWSDFLDWRDRNQTFEHLGVYRPATVNLTGGDQPERLNGAATSSEVFDAMGIGPLAGRAFRQAEDRPDADRVAVISERLWRRQFGADTGLVGRAIRIDGEPYTVVGIMPFAMRYPSRLTDIWLPIGRSIAGFPPRGAHPGLTAIGRLKPGVTIQQAAADLDTIARQLAQQYPDSNKNMRASPEPYYEQVVRNIRPALLVLIAAVAFVLLIGCANLANLTLSRAEGRHREIAIRATLGADRRRIIQQLLVESVLLSSLGGVVGAWLAWWAVKVFVASQPSTVPRIDLGGVDGRVLFFTAVVSIATGILLGLAPALRASSPDLMATLKESARGVTAGSRRFRSALVIGEVALAMVLLVGAGLTIRSFTRLMAVDPGFNPERVVTARLGVLLLGGFGVLALALAVVGIYGVLSYTVTQRTHEMGLRMALGATRRQVLSLVVGQGMRLTAIGIAVGLAASYALTRSLATLLFEISPHDPATFCVLAAVLGVSALGASALPALRATRVNPIDALRSE